MSNKYLKIATTVLLVSFGVVQLSLAEDFTIKVPLQLNKLHDDVTKVKIHCLVNDNAVPTAGAYLNSSQVTQFIGYGSTEVTVPANGNINETIQVKFNAHAGKDRSAATHYGCDLKLIEAGSNFVSIGSSPSTSASDQWKKAQPGLVNKVRGAF